MKKSQKTLFLVENKTHSLDDPAIKFEISGFGHIWVDDAVECNPIIARNFVH